LRNFFAALLVVSIASSIFAGGKSKLLQKSPGDIFSAKLTGSGLLVVNETTAELIDIRGTGVTQHYGNLPQISGNQRMVFSSSGSYAMILTFKGAGDYYQAERAEIVSTRDGTFIRSFENPGFNDALISDDGKVVVGIFRNINTAENSQLLFYYQNNQLLKKVSLPIITEAKLGYLGGVVGVISGAKGLVFFSYDGTQIAEFGRCQSFDFTNNIQLAELPSVTSCVYADGNKIGFYSQYKGDIKWEKSFGDEIIREVTLQSVAGNFLAMSKHHLYFIKGATGELMWSHSVEPPMSLTSCDISGGADTYIAWGWEIDEGRKAHPFERHTKGGYSMGIREYGRSKFIVQSEDLSYSAWNIYTPKVEFQRFGLLIQTMDEVRFLNIKTR